MSNKVLGIDVDGCLADFNYGYKNQLFDVSGVRRIGLNEEPQEWYYARAVGYTEAEDAEAWRRMKADPMFWATLPAYPSTRRVLNELDEMVLAGHEVYFLTIRMGINPHLQTRYWLEQNGSVAGPQVLIVKGEGKGPLVHTLGITHFIDDKPANCADAKLASPECEVFLLEQPWNVKERPELAKQGIHIIPSFSYFFQALAGVTTTHAKS